MGSGRSARAVKKRKTTKTGKWEDREAAISSLIARLCENFKGERAYQEWRGQVYAIWCVHMLFRELTPRIASQGEDCSYLIRRLGVLGIREYGARAKLDFAELPEHLFTK